MGHQKTRHVTLAEWETARALVDEFIRVQGNGVSAAATLGVHATSLYRWRSGEYVLHGPPLVAIRAVLAHPEDYTEYTTLARPAHRPKPKDD